MLSDTGTGQHSRFPGQTSLADPKTSAAEPTGLCRNPARTLPHRRRPALPSGDTMTAITGQV
jgi:hypothetical protein